MIEFSVMGRANQRTRFSHPLLLCGWLGAWLVGGCILVDDLGVYWSKGTIDREIEGGWRKSVSGQPGEDEYLSFEKSGDRYQMRSFRPSTPEDALKLRIPARTLTLENHRFLMLTGIDQVTPKILGEKSAPTGIKAPTAALLRYRVDGGILSFYYLDEDILSKAIESQRLKGRLPKPEESEKADMSPPTLAQLDDDAVRFLINISGQSNYWSRVDRYERVKDLKRAIEMARAYPSTKDTPANTLVRIRQPDLKYLAEGKTDILLRHLQSSPEWRVFEERGEIIACQRNQEAGEWKASPNGFRSRTDPEWLQTRAMFRLAREAGGPFKNQFNRSFYTQVGPTESETHLKLKASDQGIESYLAVGQEGLWFEFFEQSRQEARTHTRDALQWLREFLRDIHAAEKDILKNGYAARLMPPDGIRRGKTTLEVRDDLESGFYDVRAWVNPGEPGAAFLKVLDATTDKRLSEREINLRSTERTGWSSNSSELFYYNCQVKIYEGDPNRPYDAMFELWFHPAQGGGDRKLLDTIHRVSSWQY